MASLAPKVRTNMVGSLRLEKLTKNTLIDAENLLNELRLVAKQGYAIDNEEFVDGMVACAVPIKSNQGKLLACLFTHAPVIRKDLNQLLEYLPALREAAGELSQLIDQP